MDAKPMLLDLFCGSGGAAMGYHRAGFDVVGVDIEPRPFYPFPFVQADATTFALEGFDAIHASPPCQRYSSMGNRRRRADSPDLLAPTLERLRAHGVPFIVENVTGAARHMARAITLTGGMFGLGVHRPRLFESNVVLFAPPRARPPKGHVGVYGEAPDGRRLWGPAGAATHRAANSLEEAQRAMGMGWADWHGTKEAIPPAYTEYLGRQLLAAVRTLERVALEPKP